MSEEDVFGDDNYNFVKKTEDELKASKSGSQNSAPQEIPIMINALKKIYKEKLLPFELRYEFQDFDSPCLNDAYFDAKPFVLLIGQYSVGKTTFIRYLLERDFPGVRIGPEPTTDRFMVLMHGPQDRTIQGNALCADSSKPFTSLTKFGMGFLNKLECVECRSPILEKVSFIDTPGILSGEKQRTGRGYSFPEMCKWFAGRCDRILLLFDAHKLDISDELRMTIDGIRDFDDKIKVVLNKADVPTQQLVRVYGALMWSLGKVFQTPEVLRVFVGSFWDKPLRNSENRALLDLEQKDLISDLRTLPQNVAVRKVNELIKRARRAKIHALIVLHLKSKFGTFGKQKMQKKLLDNMGAEFEEVMNLHKIPKNDFPKMKNFKEALAKKDIKSYPKMKKDLLANIDDLLSKDMPKLMEMVPSEVHDDGEHGESKADNPFAHDDITEEQRKACAISGVMRSDWEVIFNKFPLTDGKVQGGDVMQHMLASGLQESILRKVWGLSDIDGDGRLDLDEFCVASYLINAKVKNVIDEMPTSLPDRLIPPTKFYLFRKND